MQEGFFPESTNVKTKFVQYHAFEEKKARLEIAKKFIEAKFYKSKAVLDFLSQRYPEIKFDALDELTKLKEENSKLKKRPKSPKVASKKPIEMTVSAK